jgi:type I restriction enzyme S subunit
MGVIQDTYKDTKIGRIPKDWDVVKLGDIAKYSQGIQVDLGLQKFKSREGYIRFLRIENYTQLSQDFRFIPIPSKKDKIISKEDIVVVRYGATAGTVSRGFDGVLANNLFQVIPSEKLDKGFLFSYISSLYSYLQSLMSGGAMPALNFGMLNLIYTPVPPLPEQQKIAAILSTLDEQISTTDKIIEKSKELKKGLMQRFFLNKAYMIMSLGKLEKTELMPIRFNQLGKILTGTTPPTANNEYYDSEDYMFIGPADLGKVKDVKSSKKYISVKGFDVTRKLPENALMVVCIGATIGKIGLTTEPCATNQQVNTIVPKDEYSARYLYYVIGGLKKYLLGFAGDTATPQLNKTDFGKVVTFIHKSKSERTKIAAILSEADAKIEKEQEQKAQLEQLKKGLMQQLLTGEKRVKV